MSDPVVNIFLIVFLGLIFGSFATAVAYRLPRGKQFITNRSECTKCGHKLGIFDLIPVISWLLQGGKCRHCGVKFGAWYMLTEIALAAMFLGIYFRFGISLQSAILAALALCFIIMIVIDFEHYIIPDGLNLTMFAIGITYQIAIGIAWQQFLFGALLGFVVGLALRWMMFIWKKKEGLGFGDVKFLAVVGLLLTTEMFTIFLFLSGVFGIIIGVMWRITGRGERFPFGPALAISLYFCLLFPDMFDIVMRFLNSG